MQCINASRLRISRSAHVADLKEENCANICSFLIALVTYIDNSLVLCVCKRCSIMTTYILLSDSKCAFDNVHAFTRLS